MALNHHIMAKATTDAILQNFKSSKWNYNGGCGADFFRVGTSADFPSPDAAFYDPTNKFLASFEFKPTTETKRGMLTGVGQSIAYLKTSNFAYLISPQIIDGFDIGGFLRDLYDTQLGNKVPVGLILYDNNNPTNLTLAHNVDTITASTGANSHIKTVSRFWAKHQDMPIPFFHLLLHYYYLRKVGLINCDGFEACWKLSMIPNDILTSFTPRPVIDITGSIITTLRTDKPLTFLEKTISNVKKNMPKNKWAQTISDAIDTTRTGDSLYSGYKKNYVTFLKHIQVIDSESNLTDSGFNLYHLGLVNGPSSKIFLDYFTKEVLTTGHHLDLLLDIDSLRMNYPSKTIDEIFVIMETDYELKGYLKRNPNRVAGNASKTEFLKFEKILWPTIGLMDDKYNIQWRKITEICALPDL